MFKFSGKDLPAQSRHQMQEVNGNISGQIGQAGRDLSQHSNSSESQTNQANQELLESDIVSLLDGVVAIVNSSNSDNKNLEDAITRLKATKLDLEEPNFDKIEIVDGLRKAISLLKESKEVFMAARPLLLQIHQWLGNVDIGIF